jgi:hypothetical protein
MRCRFTPSGKTFRAVARFFPAEQGVSIMSRAVDAIGETIRQKEAINRLASQGFLGT